MHRRFLLLLPALLLIFAAPNDEKPIFGFTSANAAKEHALEAQFDSHLNRDDLRAWMKRLSARPHHLGSAYDHDNQLFVESLFKSWGYDTHIEQFDVLFPTPKTRLLELVAPERYVAKLAEAPLPQDATSGQTAEQLPVYNAYSVDGDVTGELVYVNYGVPADYEQRARRRLLQVCLQPKGRYRHRRRPAARLVNGHAVPPGQPPPPGHRPAKNPK